MSTWGLPKGPYGAHRWVVNKMIHQRTLKTARVNGIKKEKAFIDKFNQI